MKATEWHKKEKEFAKKVLKINEFYSSTNSTLKLELPESNEFFAKVISIIESLINESTDILSILEKTKEEGESLKNELINENKTVVTNTNTRKKNEQTEEIMSVYTFNSLKYPYGYDIMKSNDKMDEQFLLKQLNFFNEEMKDKFTKEEEREKERKEYSELIESMYTDCNEMLNTDRVDFKTMKNARTNYTKIQDIIKKKITWINKYVNYETKTLSLNDIWSKTSEKGLAKKEVKSDDKKAKTILKKNVQPKNETIHFIDSNGKFRREALVDVSPMQQREFHRQFTTMVNDIKGL